MSLAPNRTILLICGAIVASIFIAYGHVLECGFINFDDGTHITENPMVLGGLSWEGVKSAFTKSHASLWIPLTWISFMADVSLFGLGAGEMHAENMLLHAANAVLLFLLLKRATSRLWASAAVAALFALHPINVESVAWVTERKNVLSLFFGLLSLHAYVSYSQRGGKSSYAASIVLFACALLAKPMLVSLPAGMLLLDIWPLRRLDKSNWYVRALEKLPFLLLTIGSSVMTMRSTLGDGTTVALDQLPIEVRVCNALVSYATYLRQLAWPSDLGVLYFHPQEVQPVATAVSLLVLVSLTVAAWVLRKHHPYLIIGWLWFLGMLVPMIGVVQVGPQAHADRFTYAAQLGIFAAVVWLISDLWGKRPRRLLAYAAAIVGAALMMATLRQVEHWTNGATLFEHTIAVTERNPRAYAGAGFARAQLGDYPAAASHYVKALEIVEDAETWNNLASALIHLDRNSEAVTAARRALAMEPEFNEARFNLASACERAGDEAQAIAEFRKVVEAEPGTVLAQYRLGMLLAKRGDIEAATQAFTEAARLRPNDSKIIEALRNIAAAKAP
jgi:tetratricopeptide (TPR) repeat protein